MPFLPSLTDESVLLHVFRRFPEVSSKLVEYHEALMRGPSPLTPRERELVAGFVSSLNACQYCAGVHVATAEAFGVEPGLVRQLVDDIDGAPLDDRLKPLLHYVKKLTTLPSRLTQADADRVFDAGWNEQALHDAVSVCALFNFMNRLVEGLGVRSDAGYFAVAGARIHERGYAPLLEMMKGPPDEKVFGD